ncbi:MAG: MarR family winged helix-turn-helix transcriptional regulator [Acidobacteriaceae bacterium]
MERAQVCLQDHAKPGSALYLVCPCIALRRASRAVTNLYDLVLSPTGLKATQFITLQIIDSYGEVAQCKFAREYGRSPETLSRSLAALRAKNLLELCADPARRERVYRLTPAGKRLLQAATVYWNRAEARLRQVLTDEQMSLVLSLADSVTSAAHEAERLKASNTSLAASASI